MAGIPSGITTALVHLDAPVSFIGQDGRIHATITSNVPLVWAATGTPIGNFIDNVSLDPGVPLELELPHTDQAGFLDQSGKSITGWFYRIEVTYELDGQTIPFPARDFQIVGAQNNVDLALIPGGTATAPVTAPQAAVIDIGGFTGSVSLEELKLHLVDNTRDLDKPISRAQAAVNARKADMVVFDPGQGSGGRRWIRLATLDGVYPDVGAHFTAILSGTGDYGDPDRGTVLIHVGQRGANAIEVKLWSFGVPDTSAPAEFYTVQTGTYAFELWAKLGGYNFNHALHTLSTSTAGVSVTVDKVSTTAPVGTVAPTAPKLWSQIDVGRVKDVAAATNLPGASTLVRRDGAGAASFAAVSVANAPTAADHLTRKDYVDSKVDSRASAITYATLGMVPTSALPPLAINDITAVASQAAMLALTAQRGDMAIRTDISKTFVLASDSPATLADWKEVMAGGQVVSVAGRTGVITLAKADVGLGNVDNTSDVNKPVSTATQTALNLKAPLASPTFTGTVGGITKTMVGLGSVDNTADTAKPVSAEQRAAIDVVGARVAAVENARKLWVANLTSNLTVGASSTLINNLPSVTLLAGHTYQIISGGSAYSDNADVAMQHRVSIAPVGSTGPSVNGQTNLIDTALWTHPTRSAVGGLFVVTGSYTPAANATVRAYSAGQVVVGGGNFRITAQASAPWFLLIRDLGIAEA